MKSGMQVGVKVCRPLQAALKYFETKTKIETFLDRSGFVRSAKWEDEMLGYSFGGGGDSGLRHGEGSLVENAIWRESSVTLRTLVCESKGRKMGDAERSQGISCGLF